MIEEKSQNTQMLQCTWHGKPLYEGNNHGTKVKNKCTINKENTIEIQASYVRSNIIDVEIRESSSI